MVGEGETPVRREPLPGTLAPGWVSEPSPRIEYARGRDSSGAWRLPFRAQRGVGVATEMLLTRAEQVSDDGACAAGLRLDGGARRRCGSFSSNAAVPWMERRNGFSTRLGSPVVLLPLRRLTLPRTPRSARVAVDGVVARLSDRLCDFAKSFVRTRGCGRTSRGPRRRRPGCSSGLAAGRCVLRRPYQRLGFATVCTVA